MLHPLTTYYIYHAFKKSMDIGFAVFKGLVSLHTLHALKTAPSSKP